MSDKKILIKDEVNKILEDGEFILYYEAYKNNVLTKKQVKELDENKKFSIFKKNNVDFVRSYQKWYSISCRVISQILPERYEEFRIQYLNPKRNDKSIDFLSYTIYDYCHRLNISVGGVPKFKNINSFVAKIQVQLSIVESCKEILDSKLANIEGFLQSDLFENELATAKDLLKKKHTRLAGALAGITLEVHLKKVCSNHSITLRKANPTISDCNEALKNAETIDLVTWRLIQRLGDIRNLSVHAKDREPTESEVQDLITGCEKLIAELF